MGLGVIGLFGTLLQSSKLLGDVGIGVRQVAFSCILELAQAHGSEGDFIMR